MSKSNELLNKLSEITYFIEDKMNCKESRVIKENDDFIISIQGCDWNKIYIKEDGIPYNIIIDDSTVETSRLEIESVVSNPIKMIKNISTTSRINSLTLGLSFVKIDNSFECDVKYVHELVLYRCDIATCIKLPSACLVHLWDCHIDDISGLNGKADEFYIHNKFKEYYADKKTNLVNYWEYVKKDSETK